MPSGDGACLDNLGFSHYRKSDPAHNLVLNVASREIQEKGGQGVENFSNSPRGFAPVGADPGRGFLNSQPPAKR